MPTIESSNRSSSDPTARRDLVSSAENQTKDPRTATRAVAAPPALPDHYGGEAASQAASSMPPSAPPLSATACKLLPEAVLDHQASALRSRLGKPADYADRPRDAAELSNVEAELQSREVAKGLAMLTAA